MSACNRGKLATLATLAIAVLSTAALAVASAQDALPRKPEGVIRIGIVKPKVQVGSSDAPQAADSVRSILAGYLQGPTIEIALLSARLPSQYTVEARHAECDYVLATTLTHHRGDLAGKLGSALGRLAGTAPYVPGVDYVKSAVVTGVLATAADFASSVKAKDEMRLEYELRAVDAAKPLLREKDKRNARADGEDLLTPLVESAAEAVGAAIAR